MIAIKNLVHRVQRDAVEDVVFDDVSVNIPTDVPFGILGAEKSGKTVLLRLLSGFLKPQSGTITRYARVSFPIGYDGVFSRSLSPFDNLRRFRNQLGAQFEDVENCVRAKCSLPANCSTPLGKLPPEIQLRFAYAATYILPFDCYLVDEKFAPNEPGFKASCLEMLESRLDSGGVIFATRRPNVIQRFCKKAAVISDNRLTVYDDIADALSAYGELEAKSATEKAVQRQRRMDELTSGVAANADGG